MFKELDIISEKYAVISNIGSITYVNIKHMADELKVLLGDKNVAYC